VFFLFVFALCFVFFWFVCFIVKEQNGCK